jgi:hypothetical protein
LRSTTTTSDVSHRIGQVDLTVLGGDGQPLDRRPVTVAQRRHAFSFGNIGFHFLGLQTHMHQGFRGEDEITETLDRFARYGLPLYLTESSLVSGHLMPPEIEDFERVSDRVVALDPGGRGPPGGGDASALPLPGGASRGAGDHVLGTYGRRRLAGCADRIGPPDGTVKPSYTALRNLIKGEWWLPPTEAVTDADGWVRVSGFFGDYDVETVGARARFAVAPGAPSATVRLSE